MMVHQINPSETNMKNILIINSETNEYEKNNPDGLVHHSITYQLQQ